MRRLTAPLGYLALALLVAGPLLGRGLFLAVDASPVPRPRLDPSYWGLGQGTHEGSLSRLPLDALLVAVAHVSSAALAQKLVLVSAVFLAGWGMHRLADVSSPGARVFAGLLFAVNPWVYDRIWAGQLFVVLGYALLPWAFGAFRSLLRGERTTAWRFVLLALAVGIASSHMALLLGLLCGVTLVFARGRAALRPALVAFGLAALASVWWLVPTPGVREVWSQVGDGQLALYASTSHGPGLLPTVVGLSGFWNDARPAVSFVPAWPALALTLLALAGGGLVLRRRDPVSLGIALAGVFGLAMALGYAWGPTRPSFAWLLAHVPPLRSFRESGKGLALVALAYAYLGSAAVEDVVRGFAASARGRVAVAVTLLLVPLVLGGRELWGAWGQLRPSSYPAAWSQADARLSAEAQGSRTLVLPFHGYFALDFAHDRVVANPAARFFRAPVAVGRSVGTADDVVDPDQRRIAGALDGPAASFADCLAASGIGRVLVLHQADWRSYGNLATRPGMSVEARWPGATLLRSSRPTSLVTARTGHTGTCRDWTPVPARRSGAFGLRLLTDAPPTAQLRINLPGGPKWRPTNNAHEFHYTGWPPYRTAYLLGLAALSVALLLSLRTWGQTPDAHAQEGTDPKSARPHARQGTDPSHAHA
jgi:hypothetical protein